MTQKIEVSLFRGYYWPNSVPALGEFQQDRAESEWVINLILSAYIKYGQLSKFAGQGSPRMQ